MTTQLAKAKQVESATGQRGAISIVGNGLTLEVPPEVHRLDEFRRWATREDFPDRIRVFFNQGAISLDMSNEELQSHVEVKGECTRVLATLVRERDSGEFYTAGVLLTNETAEVSNNPDAVFIRWESFDSGRVRLVERRNQPDQFVEIEGTPDWVLEVVSRSSVTKDTVDLRDAYHRAAIPEYWIVDARGEEIDFQVLLHRKSRYNSAPSRDGWLRSTVFGCWVRLDRQRGRRKLWRYTLHLRPT